MCKVKLFPDRNQEIASSKSICDTLLLASVALFPKNKLTLLADAFLHLFQNRTMPILCSLAHDQPAGLEKLTICIGSLHWILVLQEYEFSARSA